MTTTTVMIATFTSLEMK